ncbi:hypothetical protein [Sabulicella glaciei]|uniref:Uncharacterized protein n=1 Tax=Sabulicella glaciei TaxID=2984948 RepID=A0ABT3NYD5_9PROT|nr:hypothetical protein [Roseococcus sp. MDT2-1-1]MCW8087176.1 hypothetical protein [Roseococcus sp. MDT2-1-1]
MIFPVNDPIRLAFRPAGSADLPAPADGGPPLDGDQAIPIPGEITFDEVVEGLNPLHHLPGVGMIYRAATGAQIHPLMRVLGGAVTGGPLGMAMAGVMAFVEMSQPLDRIRAGLEGRPDPWLDAPPAAALASARNATEAYARWARDHAAPRTALA